MLEESIAAATTHAREPAHRWSAWRFPCRNVKQTPSRKTPRIAALFACIVFAWAHACGAESPNGAIDARIAAGEFDAATRDAEAMPRGSVRDDALTRIAVAQNAAGGRKSAINTIRAISSDARRYAALARISPIPNGSRPTSSPGSPSDSPSGGPGGNSQADFDALIELITSTVSVESWDEAGGPGSIQEFAGGVFVDTDGVLRTVARDESNQLLALKRSRNKPANDDTGDNDASNLDAGRASDLRFISLPRLEREIVLRRVAGEALDESMPVLAGLQRVQYVFVYPETNDLVIAGPAGPWTTDLEGRIVSVETGAPVVRLDDLVVLWRRLRQNGNQKFGCSITPKRENLERAQAFLTAASKKPLKPGGRGAWLNSIRDHVGRQTISVFGLDPRTRAARVLVEADYHMKLIGMGLQEGVPGVVSYLDSIEIDPDDSAPPMDVLRWWFTLNYRAIATTNERNAYELRGPGVKVLSENELLSARGERIHTGASDALNQQFASSFTRHFDLLSRKYPVYAELRNMFDLALVVALLDSEGLADRVDWSGAAFLDNRIVPIELGAAPKEVETVINHRVIGRRHVVAGVSGGVSVDVGRLVAPEKIETDSYGAAFEARRAPPRDLARAAWWWDGDTGRTP